MNNAGAVLQSPPVQVRTFFGEPRALAFLAFTEAWERFSFYGMSSILVLYLSQSLLLPGHVEHVAGIAALRSGLESVFGPLSPLALASQLFGLYSGFVYFTPLFGGIVADKWLGPRNAVVLGAVLMSAGHIAMAFDASFLLALLLLIVGCGLLKGNISTQVGTLYKADDNAGRTRGFAIFSVGINAGSVIGPLLCGLLAQVYGWHVGFGLAGILMLLGLATYLAGYNSLAESTRSAGAVVVPQGPLNRAEWRTIFALLAAMAVTIFQTIAYQQSGNMAMVWIDRSVDLQFLTSSVPVAWFYSIDPLVSILAVPFLLTWWKRRAARRGEPGELAKIATGAWIACAANLVLVIGCATADRSPAIVPITYCVLLGVAFLYYWPPLLALVSRVAPPRYRATLMGAVFLSLFMGYLIIGWLGALFELMSPLQFWAMHAAIAACGAIIAMILNRQLKGVFQV